jgi:hypothetical protein
MCQLKIKMFLEKRKEIYLYPLVKEIKKEK